jgi:hypothetical protein
MFIAPSKLQLFVFKKSEITLSGRCFFATAVQRCLQNASVFATHRELYVTIAHNPLQKKLSNTTPKTVLESFYNIFLYS